VHRHLEETPESLIAKSAKEQKDLLKEKYKNYKKGE
jgi:hypothetical protein